MPAETVALDHDAEMEAEAFSFSLTDRAFAPHYHRAWVLGCVLGGARRFWANGREYRAACGDVVILAPGVVHACAPDGDAPFVWRGFHFREGSAPAALLDAIAGEGSAPGPVIPGAGLLDGLAAAHALTGRAAPAALKRAYLSSALGRLRKCCHNAPAPDFVPAPAEPALEALRSHLESHARDRLRLEDMAAMARMDKFRLIRAFARMTGATPYRYLESARVNHAQELLRQGLAPADAALEAGFADQSHLARAFRTRLGVTPGACRRRP